MDPSPRATWRTSSYSTAQSNCVEVADLPEGGHAIRDSKNPHLQPLTFPAREWQAFLTHVTDSEYETA